MGRTRDEVRTLALAELVADPPDRVARYLARWRRTASFVPGALTFRRPDGAVMRRRADGALVPPTAPDEPLRILLRSAPRDESAHRFLALNRKLAELNREVARRRRTERLLEEEHERLAVTLASIGDAVVVADVEGRVTFLNPVAERLTGWSNREAAGRALTEVFRIVSESTREPAPNPIERVLREGVVVGLANHTVLLARDGVEYAIDDSAAPIRDGRQQTIGAVLVFHDVTDRRELEHELAARLAALAEADRRKDEFLAMLSHELRNPLAAIAAAHELSRTLAPDDPARGRIYGVLDRQLGVMRRVVDDLLDVSRVARGRIEIRRAPLDLAAILRAEAADARARAEVKGIDLRLTPAAGPLPVEGDETRLGQVFGNLLDNALKYTPPGGRVEIFAGTEDGAQVVRVRDTGTGIAAEDRERIFGIFEQGRQTIARTEGGLGVGLALVRLLVELHGGQVFVTSDGPGLGSEFTVRLPVGTGDPESAPTSFSGPSGKKRRVLVVDDNEDAASTLAMLVDAAGHEARTARNGEEALARFREFAPDLVLLDIGLPGMDGYEAARRMRALDPGRRVVLAAVTGYGQPGDRERSRAAGFDHHLVKPVPPDVLRDLLGRP